MKIKLLATLAVALLLASNAVPADASEPPLHPDVEYAIGAVPGGTVLDAYTAVWPDLNMTLSVPAPFSRSRAAVGNCANGQFCAYSGINASGSKLTWSTCAVVSTAALTKVGSIANARSTGAVTARNAAGTVLATASAGKSTNVIGATTSLRCNL